MPSSIVLKRGFDIRIQGSAQKILSAVGDPPLYAVKPTDFPGLIPKLSVRAGDKVLAGTQLFHDKLHPEILFTSPVSGKVTEIVRGERRMILEVVIEKSGNDFIDFGKSNPETSTREFIKKVMLISGLWPVIRQRPYHIVANPGDVPKSIFISGFDTSPLAPDYNFIMDNVSLSFFRGGINALKKLTDGKIHLALNGKGGESQAFKDIGDVHISRFSGPHPAGNVGVHIHHLDPVVKGEVVWYVNLQDVLTIGRLFEQGSYNPEKIIALTGSEVINPQYYKIRTGASISYLVKDNVKAGNLRYISGNVLTGTKINETGFIGFYDSQVTVIPEGNQYEFLGWAKPGIKKFSYFNAFLSKLIPGKKYRLDTNLHGGERAFVLTGVYEKVLPMDIFPMQLCKAIIAEDIDNMENLGIYEVAEEDLALCEYVCPSKTEIQAIIRKGIALMRKEMS
ncbi:MAG TPA: Na(+)-translocating NADH-quinone reductase subunit A [Bacteroidales bacterium]|nr:Na(+)-translocating NADH-quinone reductase subunit A [Bacteroidales bacterium]